MIRHVRHRTSAMLRRQASVLCLLLLAAVDAAGAQAAVRRDSSGIAHGTWSASWTATNGSFMGTWTAVPDTTRGTVSGSWTLVDAQGAMLAFGGWAAAKSAAKWTGTWRANVTGRGQEYSGTWSSSIDLKSGARLIDLFEHAAQTIVRGTWNSGGRSGAWSIRAAK